MICPRTVATEALARDVLASADCLIADQVRQGYAALLAPGGSFVTALTIGLTIYVAIFGYRLVLGLSSLTLGEVVPHFVKIGLVLALATSWPSYQALVFDLLFKGPEELANLVIRQTAGAGSGDVLAALQAVFERLTDTASDAWAQVTPAAAPVAAAPVIPGIPVAPVVPVPAVLPFSLGAPQFIAALLWLSALVMMAMSVGVLLVVRIVLALLLLLGPLFVALALFAPTRTLFEGWMRVTVKFALVPLFVLPLIAVLLAVLGPVVATLDGAPMVAVRDSPALLIVLIVLVFAAVIFQAARLGGGIADGIRLPRRSAVPAPASTSSSTSSVERSTEAGRAQTIVQAIDAGNRRTVVGSVGTTPAAIVATRTITGPSAAPAPAADYSARLGQGYRRLAVSSTPRPRT